MTTFGFATAARPSVQLNREKSRQTKVDDIFSISSSSDKKLGLESHAFTLKEYLTQLGAIPMGGGLLLMRSNLFPGWQGEPHESTLSNLVRSCRLTLKRDDAP
jgi:hypothetical protein